MSPDNIHIELSGDTLNVSGEKRVERHHRDQQGGVKMHRTERTFNKFSRCALGPCARHAVLDLRGPACPRRTHSL